ncbi:MAG: hypothetical protein NVV60_02095 [Luteimonas sp.]|nr:hypothetical protein [Luteimonas sp.]
MKPETQKAVLSAAGRYIRKLLGPIEVRLQLLESTIGDLRKMTEAAVDLDNRVRSIEDRGIRYRGSYQRSDDYRRGDLVTHQGGMWHAIRETREEPGMSIDWQLTVKKRTRGMNIDNARQQYPKAFEAIQKRMRDLELDTGAKFIPYTAAIVHEGMQQLLEVTALTDLVPEGSSDSVMLMRFQERSGAALTILH